VNTHGRKLQKLKPFLVTMYTAAGKEEEREMKKNLTELVFILDRSGSMAGLESDTIGGFNSMLEKQKREPGRAYVTTVLFDNRWELLHDHWMIQEVEPMNEKQYYVRGC